MPSDTAKKDYFTWLFEQHHRALYAYAFKKLRDTFLAEEIVQTSFIRFWQHKGSNALEEEVRPEHFLFYIAKGLIVDQLRKKRLTVAIESASLPAEALTDNTVSDKYDLLHYTGLLQQAMLTLPPRQKQIFEMNYFGQMKNEEIAATLSLSRQTVKNLLSKAVKQLRKTTVRQFLFLFTGLL